MIRADEATIVDVERFSWENIEKRVDSVLADPWQPNQTRLVDLKDAGQSAEFIAKEVVARYSKAGWRCCVTGCNNEILFWAPRTPLNLLQRKKPWWRFW